MIGRPKNFDQHAALRSAMELFWQRGYAATSLDDLLGVMSISKSSFYAEFKSKDALYRVCLKEYQQMILEHLEQVRFSSGSIREFLEAIFEEVIGDAQSGDPKGCLIVNSAVEFGQHKPQFGEEVRCALKAVQGGFEKALRSGKQDGRFESADSPKVTAKYLTTCISGIRSMIKGGMTVRDARSVVGKILDSLER
jgi:TetR/AcrR family transcriptional regulator, transcriptional repressor for nem operon